MDEIHILCQTSRCDEGTSTPSAVESIVQATLLACLSSLESIGTQTAWNKIGRGKQALAEVPAHETMS